MASSKKSYSGLLQAQGHNRPDTIAGVSNRIVPVRNPGEDQKALAAGRKSTGQNEDQKNGQSPHTAKTGCADSRQKSKQLAQS